MGLVAAPLAGALISAINSGGSREIAAKISATLPKIGLYESSERVLGTTVGIRGLGMPAPSTFAFDVDPSGRRAGLAALKRSIDSDTVTMADFDTALKDTRASVTEAMEKDYEKIQGEIKQQAILAKKLAVHAIDAAAVADQAGQGQAASDLQDALAGLERPCGPGRGQVVARGPQQAKQGPGGR